MAKKWPPKWGILSEAHVNKSEDILNVSVFKNGAESDRYNGVNVPTIHNNRNIFAQVDPRLKRVRHLLSDINSSKKAHKIRTSKIRAPIITRYNNNNITI
tara:strand:- start:356 stop:655 length:300 start_codon:yes stop_codon:yes gene_type:complete